MPRVPDSREARPATRAPPVSTSAPDRASRAGRVLDLQRSAGNRAVSRLVQQQSAVTRSLARQSAGTVTPHPPAPTGDFMVRDVDRQITETISHAPARFSAWNNTFSWRSKWRLRLDLRTEIGALDVIVRLNSSASAAVKTAWEHAITSKWSERFAFCVLREHPIQIRPGVVDRFEEMYPIRIVVAWVDRPSDAHYVIRANAADAAEGGRAGAGGTTSMTGWGTADTQDITHEFGHILGCPEEYFTTDGVDYAAGGGAGFRDPSGGVMNNPAGPALARNFRVICQEAADLRGIPRARTEVAPWR